MAKAIFWSDTGRSDAKAGVTTGLDTLVVHAVKRWMLALVGLLFSGAANALGSCPNRPQVKTQDLTMGPASGGVRF